MKKVTFHEEAQVEIDEAAWYYEERAPGLGMSFIEDVEQSVDQVLANPEGWQLVGHHVRRKPVRRFPYGLLYAVETDRVRIMAIAHDKRRPGYWRNRL